MAHSRDVLEWRNRHRTTGPGTSLGLASTKETVVVSSSALRRTRLLAAFAAVALFGAACGGGDDTTATGGGGDSKAPYKIGVALALTGVSGAIGEPQKKALELFSERLEEKGGINGHPVEFVYVDTTSDESQAVNVIRKLATQDNVVAIVGPSSSGEGIAAKGIVDSLKVPTITIAGAPGIVAPPVKYMFKEFPSPLDGLKGQLEYLKEKGMNKVGIIFQNNAYGQAPAEAMPDMVKELGMEMGASVPFPPAATDVTPQLQEVAKDAPDALIVYAVTPANAVVAKNAKAIGLKSQVFQSPGAASTAYIKLAADAAEGTLVQGSKILAAEAVAKDDPQYEAIQEFAGSHEEKYGELPSQFAAGAWDAMTVMVAAIEKADPDGSDVPKARDAIRDALEELDPINGVVAVYDYTPDQHGTTGTKGFAILRVEGGKYVVEASS